MYHEKQDQQYGPASKKARLGTVITFDDDTQSESQSRSPSPGKIIFFDDDQQSQSQSKSPPRTKSQSRSPPGKVIFFDDDQQSQSQSQSRSSPPRTKIQHPSRSSPSPRKVKFFDSESQFQRFESQQDQEQEVQIQSQQPSSSECLKWLTNPYINPITGRKISEKGKIYKYYKTTCEKLVLLPTRQITPQMSQEINSFIKKDGHIRQIYIESVWKTIGKKHNLCFLHPISVKFVNVRNYDSFDTNFQPWNIPNLRPRFFVFSHFGRYRMCFSTSSQIHDPYCDPQRLIPEKYLADEITKCNNPKLMAILIQLPMHSNMLVINTDRKEVEHFEPNGVINIPQIANLYMDSIKQLITSLFPEYKYIEPLKLCPNFKNSTIFKRGFQTLSPYPYLDNSCSLWSIWYAYVRLSNPLIERDEILQIAVKTIESTDFTRFIENMLQGLTSWIDIVYNSELNSYTFQQGKILPMTGSQQPDYPIFHYEQQPHYTMSRVQAQTNQRRVYK